MTLDAETLLLPALFAFYATDCLLLLDANEGVFERRGAHEWGVAFGSRNYTLGGRQPCLLHLLTPHRPTYRLHWTMSQIGSSAAWMEDAPRALLSMIPWPAAIAMALFGLVPLALLLHIGLPLLLGAVGLVYVLIIGMMVHAWRCRQQLGIDARPLIKLAAELLLCPPYAVNVVRKLSLLASPAGDLLETARIRLGSDALVDVHFECAEQIRLQLEVEGEDTPRSTALVSARQGIIARAGIDDAE